jgi:hypothetical protein
MNHPCVEKNPLRKSCLASINVRTDADIPRALQRILAIRAIEIGGHGVDKFQSVRKRIN